MVARARSHAAGPNATPRAHVDILFDEVSGKLRFENLRLRCVRVSIGKSVALVAALEDVIAFKETAGRPKDLAQPLRCSAA
jgi:hypothetical protein